ncbi:MAG: BON domain-containing protein [Planctomycetaceae bacterium]
MKQYRRVLRPTFFAMLGASLLSQSASAQFSSNAATRTTGGSGTTGSAANAYSTGASGAGGNSGSIFGGGQGAGSSGLGQSGQAGNTQNRQINTQSQLGLNQNGFLGQGNNQQNFVGRNQPQNNSQDRQNNNNNRGGQGNFGQNDPNNQNGQGQQNQDPKRAIRPQLKVAFETSPRPTSEIRSTLQPRFETLSRTPALRGVSYELDAEGVVVLRGSVETPSQKRLAENVVKLEPGVKKVRNELTLNEPAATK